LFHQPDEQYPVLSVSRIQGASGMSIGFLPWLEFALPFFAETVDLVLAVLAVAVVDEFILHG
jgi:hypothetical protein